MRETPHSPWVPDVIRSVDTKTSEIPTATTLLKTLDLTGTVVTMDVLRTQKDTATLITDGDGDYAFTAKANMPTLHRELKVLPWTQVKGTSSTERHRGNQITRTIKVVDTPSESSTPPRRRAGSVM